MDKEKYILDNYINKIAMKDDNGKRYIIDTDIDDLDLNSEEKNLIIKIMNDNNIELRVDLTKDDNVDNKYEELDRFLKDEFVPEKCEMLIKKKEYCNESEKKGNRNILVSIPHSCIEELHLDEEEYEHVMDYLDKNMIVISGLGNYVDEEYELYDYKYEYLNNFPKSLSREENEKLFALFSVTKDEVIKEQLIVGNLRLAGNIAFSFSYAYDIDIDELNSYGYEGLILAVNRFNPSLGNAFSSFAVPYIKDYIKSGRKEIEFVKKGSWADSFYKFRNIVEKENDKKICGDADLIYEVAKMMEEDKLREKGDDISNIDDKKVNDNFRRIQFLYQEDIADLVYDEDSPEEELKDSFNMDDYLYYSYQNDSLSELLSKLTVKERNVFGYIYGLNGDDPKTVSEVAKIYGVTHQRIVQIKNNALRKLRRILKKNNENDSLNDDDKKNRIIRKNRFILNDKEDKNYDEKSLAEWKKEWEEVTGNLSEDFQKRKR